MAEGRVSQAARAKAVSAGRWGVLFMVLGCSDERGMASIGETSARIELDQRGKVFALATSLHLQRSPSARQREMAARATGALLVPLVDAAGTPLVAGDGSLVRGTCGVTFITPSYAVTAAHCVNGADSDLGNLVVEMYRPTPALDQGLLRRASLTGSFPDFAHPRLDASDGYLVDRYDCRLVSRCADRFGGPVHCELDAGSTVDTALLFCAGLPGHAYGFVDLAAQDDPQAEVFMPWKHEVYALSASSGDDLWEHYVVAPPNLGGLGEDAPLADFADNYHYFGQDPSGSEHHQLLPLIPVDFTDDSGTSVPHRKATATNIGVNTDLLGCHGTSGAGVLQQGLSGRWELLGPVFDGNPEHESYLCNHVPALDGFPRGPGCQGVNYMLLGTTEYLWSRNLAEIRTDCDPFARRSLSLFTHGACWLGGLEQRSENSGWSDHLTQASVTSSLDTLHGSVVGLGPGEPVSLVGFTTEANERYRLGLTAWSASGCASAPCPRVSLSIDGSEVLGFAFTEAPPEPVPVAATFLAPRSDSVTLAVLLQGGQQVELGSVTLRPESEVNHFDSEPDRLEAALLDLETAALAQPMRFVGDGRQGFAAWLGPRERLVLTRQAVVPGRRWTARFSVTPWGLSAEGATSPPAALSCGLVDGPGRVVMTVDCSLGFVQLDDTQSLAARGGFFVETRADSSPVLVDDVALVSDAMPDADGDSIPDVVDDCPTGPLPVGESLRVDLPETSTSIVCVPEPAIITVPVPVALNACEPPTLSGQLTTINGRPIDPLVVNVSSDGQLLLPLGTHAIRWQVEDALGHVHATLTHSVTVAQSVGPECCAAGQVLTTGTATSDALPLTQGPAACVLGEAGDDFVVSSGVADWLWGGPGNDYLGGGGGDDVLLGGDGDDYLAAGRGGSATVYAGPGDDTVHARGAASARIFGGAGADVLVGSDGPDHIYPGPGTVLVLAGDGDDQVRVYDECELSAGMRLVGGDGQDQLTLPVSLEVLAEKGVEVAEFEQVVVDAQATYLSDCFGG